MFGVIFLYIDALLMGLGSVLMQTLRVAACASHQLRMHEWNYPTHDLDFVSMVFTLGFHRSFSPGFSFGLSAER